MSILNPTQRFLRGMYRTPNRTYRVTALGMLGATRTGTQVSVEDEGTVTSPSGNVKPSTSGGDTPGTVFTPLYRVPRTSVLRTPTRTITPAGGGTITTSAPPAAPPPQQQTMTVTPATGGGTTKLPASGETPPVMPDRTVEDTTDGGGAPFIYDQYGPPGPIENRGPPGSIAVSTGGATTTTGGSGTLFTPKNLLIGGGVLVGLYLLFK